MRLHQNGGRTKLGLVTVLAFVVGLVGSTGASAAPGDNLRNAGKCLRAGGWHTLQTSTGRSFSGPISCVIYALRGGTFGVATVPAPEAGPGTPPVKPPSAE